MIDPQTLTAEWLLENIDRLAPEELNDLARDFEQNHRADAPEMRAIIFAHTGEHAQNRERALQFLTELPSRMGDPLNAFARAILLIRCEHYGEALVELNNAGNGPAFQDDIILLQATALSMLGRHHEVLEISAGPEVEDSNRASLLAIQAYAANAQNDAPRALGLMREARRYCPVLTGIREHLASLRGGLCEPATHAVECIVF